MRSFVLCTQSFPMMVFRSPPNSNGLAVSIHFPGWDQPTPDPSFSRLQPTPDPSFSRLLQQRLRAVSWPHWRLRCMQATARLRHGSCQTLTTLTRRPLSVSRAPHVLSSCVPCLAPPAVDLLEALDRRVCTRRARCFCLRISHFCCFRSASSSGLERRRFPSPAS